MRKECWNCKNWQTEKCDDCYARGTPTNWQPGENYEPDTNAERIRGMTVGQLAEFINSLAFKRETPWSEPFEKTFCKECQRVEVTVEGTNHKMFLSECDFADGECPHGNDIVWWLKQPVEE